jgi:hypothetical protein
MSDIWRWLNTKLFDENGIEAIFAHIRNLAMATVIMAAGSYANRNQPDHGTFGILDLELASLGVEAIGFVMVGLNFLDGLRKLGRLGSSLVLRIGLAAMYVLFTVRLIQFLVLLRGG